MSKVKLVLLVNIVLASLLFSAMVYQQHQKINRQSADIALKVIQIDELGKKLTDEVARTSQAQKAYEAAQSDAYHLAQKVYDLSDQNNTQKQQIRKLENENQHVKNWLNTPVPADIVGLLGEQSATPATDRTD